MVCDRLRTVYNAAIGASDKPPSLKGGVGELGTPYSASPATD